jgi:hypothetical protein
MARFAVLTDNLQTIGDIIIADTVEIAEAVTNVKCVAVPKDLNVGMGWTYVDGIFIEPTIKEEADATI